jgi:hypothetical protein
VGWEEGRREEENRVGEEDWKRKIVGGALRTERLCRGKKQEERGSGEGQAQRVGRLGRG